ncbi:Dyp-type peroxidase family [Cyclobacterium xiamenense]|uniref:Dyp-type peroxidase family n=2 Tax=Cyclobacterium xiamenense TaxID=1297121 RepID=A0A1H6ZDP1_9BACT|nr:Dyp-type peroxidase family [Cyclobacterium xiamenense]
MVTKYLIMNKLEKEDIQGLLVRGYGNLPTARYLLYTGTDPGMTLAFIREILPKITPASEKPASEAFQVAFTHPGLAFLQLPDAVLDSFSREFKEGMNDIHRQLILGDTGEHASHHWNWGDEPLHFLLLVYAKDEQQLEKSMAWLDGLSQTHGVQLKQALPTGLLYGQKEHFGFRDDISRPIIRELVGNTELDPETSFPAGEFIMGYKNLYDEFAPAPTVPQALDPQNKLPPHPDYGEQRDLGKNGCYLVFRQMEQRVSDFWQYMKTTAGDADAAIALASKMVGRWPDGSPLTRCPTQPDPSLSDANDFGFWEEDKAGLKCPIGAHIRRTNPRDHLVTERTQKDSREMAAKHRMLRKGRPYGPPLSPELDPHAILQSPDDGSERGLHFICLVTDIRRQFEFVQNNWVNFHKFGGLENDADPIIGNHYQNERRKTDSFSIPEYPVRKVLSGLPNFTVLKGGAYFFFPGIRALHYLSANG